MGRPSIFLLPNLLPNRRSHVDDQLKDAALLSPICSSALVLHGVTRLELDEELAIRGPLLPVLLRRTVRWHHGWALQVLHTGGSGARWFGTSSWGQQLNTTEAYESYSSARSS